MESEKSLKSIENQEKISESKLNEIGNEANRSIKIEENIDIEQFNKCLIDVFLKNESKIIVFNLEDDEKFIVRLQHVGNAPIMKNTKLNIKSSANSRLVGIYTFIKDALKSHLKENDTIIIYCNRNFCPSPTTLLKDLFLNFNVNNELILNYAIQEAWG